MVVKNGDNMGKMANNKTKKNPKGIHTRGLL